MSVLGFIDRLEALPVAARITIAWLACLVPRALAAAQLGLVGDYLVFADPSARPESYWYPLYGALARALWACSGGSVSVYTGWHLALHSLVGPLVHGSGRRLGLSGATCWFAVVGVALLPYYVSLGARQPQTGVVITLAALSLWAFLGWRDSGFGWRGMLGFPLLALFSALLRPNLLVSLGAFWAVALFEARRVPTNRPSPAARVLASGALVAGILLGLAAASKARTGHWSLFEPITGYNLWLGHNEHTGEYLRRWDIITFDEMARLYGPEGIPIEGNYEQDQAYGHLAIEFARTHPRETVVNTFLKAGRYWDFRLEDSDKNPIYWNLAYAGPYLACVVLGLFGVRRMARRGNRKALLLIILLLVSYCLPHLLFYPAVRYRMTTEFALIMLAAEGLTGMMARRHGGGRHRLTRMRHGSVLLAAAFLFVAVPRSSSAASPTDKAGHAMQKGDFKTALDELRPLAAKNDPNAQFLLGMLYDSGKGVAQDQAAAASWYRRAAEQNHVLAQLFLGVLLYSGQGVKQDYLEAARWFQNPAESGNEQAQFYLGSMYANGTGLKKDDSEAVRWLTKSAAQRNTRAMGMLATTLFSRSRDDRDLVDAYAWSHLAAELDPVQALTSARGVIEKYCSREQTKRGKAVMAEWKRQWANEAKRRTPDR